MAIPAAAGIFILIDSIATKLYYFLLTPWAKKISIMAVFTAGWLLGWGALWVLSAGIRSGLNVVVPDTLRPAVRIIYYHMPGNLSYCIASLMALGLAKWAWEKKEQWMVTAAQAG